jgi:hypothetical protein
MEFFCFHSRKGNYKVVFCVDTNLYDRTWRQQTLMYCDTIYRTEVGGRRPFCIVTTSTGQTVKAADPSVL